MPFCVFPCIQEKTNYGSVTSVPPSIRSLRSFHRSKLNLKAGSFRSGNLAVLIFPEISLSCLFTDTTDFVTQGLDFFPRLSVFCLLNLSLLRVRPIKRTMRVSSVLYVAIYLTVTFRCMLLSCYILLCVTMVSYVLRKLGFTMWMTFRPIKFSYVS